MSGPLHRPINEWWKGCFTTLRFANNLHLLKGKTNYLINLFMLFSTNSINFIITVNCRNSSDRKGKFTGNFFILQSNILPR